MALSRTQEVGCRDKGQCCGVSGNRPGVVGSVGESRSVVGILE